MCRRHRHLAHPGAGEVVERPGNVCNGNTTRRKRSADPRARKGDTCRQGRPPRRPVPPSGRREPPTWERYRPPPRQTPGRTHRSRRPPGRSAHFGRGPPRPSPRPTPQPSTEMPAGSGERPPARTAGRHQPARAEHRRHEAAEHQIHRKRLPARSGRKGSPSRVRSPRRVPPPASTGATRALKNPYSKPGSPACRRR